MLESIVWFSFFCCGITPDPVIVAQGPWFSKKLLKAPKQGLQFGHPNDRWFQSEPIWSASWRSLNLFQMRSLNYPGTGHNKMAKKNSVTNIHEQIKQGRRQEVQYHTHSHQHVIRNLRPQHVQNTHTHLLPIIFICFSWFCNATWFTVYLEGQTSPEGTNQGLLK